ncbi:hypothetical protein BC624_101205 [Flavobacterium granuli]|uniref:Uncharacterized protein n=1 Tax=Flavobacterium granuli TaxID=280093 RepID=A0A1M5IDQ6_9FLAO|nr:hypothetical protein BC624_101205 [Flavobacterium granuli]SHG26412.1 hypothetical protein SAMN05443373_101205 [Flavobacterium granuli]
MLSPVSVLDIIWFSVDEFSGNAFFMGIAVFVMPDTIDSSVLENDKETQIVPDV